MTDNYKNHTGVNHSYLCALENEFFYGGNRKLKIGQAIQTGTLIHQMVEGIPLPDEVKNPELKGNEVNIFKDLQFLENEVSILDVAKSYTQYYKTDLCNSDGDTPIFTTWKNLGIRPDSKYVEKIENFYRKYQNYISSFKGSFNEYFPTVNSEKLSEIRFNIEQAHINLLELLPDLDTYEKEKEIYWKINYRAPDGNVVEMEAKGMIDLYRDCIIDIKSYSGHLQDTMRDRYWYRQLAFYREGVYTLTGKYVPCYIYAVNVNNGKVTVFEISEKDLEVGKFGGYLVPSYYDVITNDLKSRLTISSSTGLELENTPYFNNRYSESKVFGYTELLELYYIKHFKI